ncbi:MAG: phosphatidate cytidylyltransferase [Anaerolineae bacterium]|nr:phosphatidate cytidylyltransferase [Anaerolineae bacterium]
MTTTVNQDTSEQEKPENEAPKKPRSISNLILRLMTGLIGLPLIVFLIFWGGWLYTIMASLLAILGTAEFYFMERTKGRQNNAIIGIAAAIAVLLSFHWREPRLWQAAVVISVILTFTLEFVRSGQGQHSFIRTVTTLGGSLYIAFPLAFVIAIRQVEPFGIHWVAAILFCTWGTDTFSYMFGSMFGKTKLAPKLSPKKTVEGAIGGVIFGVLLPILLMLRIDNFAWTMLPLFIISPFAGIAGDLFESGVKRYFGIKDSHIPGFDVIPGHGGVLDRMDSVLWIIPLFYAYLLIIGKLPLPF